MTLLMKCTAAFCLLAGVAAKDNEMSLLNAFRKTDVGSDEDADWESHPAIDPKGVRLTSRSRALMADAYEDGSELQPQAGAEDEASTMIPSRLLANADNDDIAFGDATPKQFLAHNR
eukprot:gnl/MRDRNA2_/MRDRNA2_102160_c0_seq1.p1 gnl/MRDRNA2_/MRDRNA2_102160_c0~~gnl/MRDRNA2_/MRDRNA2_102160_c0_seq1.p1  ORF type:complete len:117 (-),score=27.75 gnl/MRDRNA2_/MRDRNA2_102160_c0_seq1:37-387(-)